MASVDKDPQLLFRPIEPPEAPDSFYNGFSETTQILPEGHQRYPRSRPFPKATIYERDQPIPMRDGVILRADIFRPADETTRVPAVLPWSPYGKSGTGSARLEMVPAHIGIPFEWLSDYEKFEAPDPADWVARGYAVVNIDTRGSWDSEGDLYWFGSAEGRDGYDAVEYIGKLPWCNGSICMAGNSWLGIGQWVTAAEQPPSLKCIAPFEGASDVYREIICRGGIPYTPFFDWVASTLRGMLILFSPLYGANSSAGRSRQENLAGMIREYPLMNAYWADKRVDHRRINVPAYVVASYSTCLHTPGTLRGFEEISSKDKWLRIHDTQEWHDLYQPSTNDELQRFFDRYTKGINNGWEETPKVRVSLLGFNEPNIVDHVVSDWPVPGTKYEKLYLAPNGQLSNEAPTSPSRISYPSDVPAMQEDRDEGEISFKYTFASKGHLLGSATAVLYVSCDDLDDMDVFTQIRKADRNGKILWSYNVPLKDLERMGMKKDEVPVINPMIYLGPTGQLRASHRAVDDAFTKAHWRVHSHKKRELIPVGNVVRLEIGLWPGGMIFEEGESLVFKISGHWMTLAEYPHLRGQFSTQNKGMHHVHLGGPNASYILVPFIEM